MADVAVRGRYLKGDDTPASGQVTFAPRPRSINDSGDGDILVSSAVTAVLDDAGEFEVTLQASDDPSLAPTGWTYLVVERITGARGVRAYDIDVPTSAAGPGIDLWDVAPASPASGDPTVFPTLAAFAALDGRVDDLEGGSGPYDPAGAAAAAQAASDPVGTAAALQVARARLSDGIFSAVDAALAEEGRPAAVQVQGDSTGNATDEWVYLLTQWLGERHPDAHVKYKVWNDATQAYGAWSVVQAGAAGETRATFNGTTTRTMFTAPVDIPAVVGDIDIRARVSMDDWTPAVTATLISHYGAAGSRCWKLSIAPAGGIDFIWTTDGTTNIQKVTATPTGFANGTEGWVRVTLDVDNGAGGYSWRGYKSTDGVTWTEIGSSITNTGGATSIFNNPAQEYEIGGRGSTGDLWAGKVYEVQIRDGIDGKITNPQPITSWMPRVASGGFVPATFGGGPTLYVINGSHPGASLTYLADATRHPKMVHPYAGSLNFQSCSHNDGSSFGAAYVAARDAWQALTDARAVGSQTAVLTQNPEVTPIESPSIHAHAQRRKLLAAWAARKGLVLVDIYGRFLANPGGAAPLLQADGVHPTVSIGDGTKGQDVWLDCITDAWTAV